jgi:hypothetical protein
MGFWQGVAEAYKDISAERTRAREIQDERDYRKKEKEEERAFQRDMLMKKVEEDRRNNILNLMAKRRSTGANAEELALKAQAFAARVGETDDPRMKEILANPALAAAMLDQIDVLDQGRNKEGQRVLRGSELLDTMTYFTKDGSLGVTPGKSFGLDDLDRLSTDPKAYEEALLELSQGGKSTQPVVRIDPEAFRAPSIGQEKRATDYFNGMILQAANVFVENSNLKGDAYGDLKATIDDAAKNPDGAGMATLYRQFGADVYTNFVKLTGADTEDFLIRNPVIANFLPKFKEDIQRASGVDPETSQIQSDIKYLQDVIANSTSEAEKKRAKTMLDQLVGQMTGAGSVQAPRPSVTPAPRPTASSGMSDSYGGYGNLAGDYSNY